MTYQGRVSEAEPLLRHLLETTSLQSGFLNLSVALMAQGKQAAADSVLDVFRRRWPESTRPDDIVRAGYYMRRDYHAIDSLFKDPALRVPTSQTQRMAVQLERMGVATALGRVGEAERMAAQLAPAMAAAGSRGGALYLQSLLAQIRAFFLGDDQAMARAADSLYPKSVLDSLPVDQRPYQGLGYAYALAGQVSAFSSRSLSSFRPLAIPRPFE